MDFFTIHPAYRKNSHICFNSPVLSLQNILYGAANSTLFPGQVWGGMTADTAIYTQSGVDLSNLLSKWDQDNNSQWRVFSKLGKSLVDLFVCLFV